MPTPRTRPPNESDPSEASTPTSTSGTTLPHSTVLLPVDNEDDEKTDIGEGRVASQQQFALVTAHESPTAGASAFACQRSGISSGPPQPSAETDVKEGRSKKPNLETRAAIPLTNLPSQIGASSRSRPKKKTAKGTAINFPIQISAETFPATHRAPAKKSQASNSGSPLPPSSTTATISSQAGTLKAQQQQREIETMTGKAGSDERKKKRNQQRTIGVPSTPPSRAQAQLLMGEEGAAGTQGGGQQRRKTGGSETASFATNDVGTIRRDEKVNVPGVVPPKSGGLPTSTIRHRLGAHGFASFAVGKDAAVGAVTPLSSRRPGLTDSPSPSQTQPSSASSATTTARASHAAWTGEHRGAGITPRIAHMRGDDEAVEVATLDHHAAMPSGALRLVNDSVAGSGRGVTVAETDQVLMGNRVVRTSTSTADSAADNAVQVIGTSESRTPAPKDVLPSRRKSNTNSESEARLREHVALGSDRSDSTSSSLSGGSSSHPRTSSGINGDHPEEHHAVIQVIAGHSSNAAQHSLNRRDSNGSVPEESRAIAVPEASSPLQRASQLDAATAAATNAANVVANAALDEERGRKILAEIAATVAEPQTIARVVEQLRQRQQQQQEVAALGAIARRQQQLLHQHNHHLHSTTVDEAAAAAAAIRVGLDPLLFHSSVNGGNGGTGGASTGSSTAANAAVLDHIKAHMLSTARNGPAASTPATAPIVSQGGGGGNHLGGLLGLNSNRSAPPPPPAPAATSAPPASTAGTFPFSTRALFDGTVAFFDTLDNSASGLAHLLMGGRSATVEGGDRGSQSSTTERSAPRRISAGKTQRRNARSQGNGENEVITIDSSDDEEGADEAMQDNEHVETDKLKRKVVGCHDAPGDEVHGDQPHSVPVVVARDGERSALHQQRKTDSVQTHPLLLGKLKVTTAPQDRPVMLDAAERTGCDAQKKGTNDQQQQQRKKLKRTAVGEADAGSQSMIRSVLKSFNSTSSRDDSDPTETAAPAPGESGLVSDKADGPEIVDSVAKVSRWTNPSEPSGRGRKRGSHAVADGTGEMERRHHRKVDAASSKVHRRNRSNGSLKTSWESREGPLDIPEAVRAERRLPRGHINSETRPLKDTETYGQFDDDEDCANKDDRGQGVSAGITGEDSPIEIVRVHQPPHSKMNGKSNSNTKHVERLSAAGDETGAGSAVTKAAVKRLPVSLQLASGFVHGMLTNNDEVFAGAEGVPEGDVGLAIAATAKNLIRILPSSAQPNAANRVMRSREASSATNESDERKAIPSAASTHDVEATDPDPTIHHQDTAATSEDQQHFILTRSDFDLLAAEVVADRRRVARMVVQRAFMEMTLRHEQAVSKITARLSSEHSRTKQHHHHPVAKLQHPAASSSLPSSYSSSIAGETNEERPATKASPPPPPPPGMIIEQDSKHEADVITGTRGEAGATDGSLILKASVSRGHVSTETSTTQSSVARVASVDHTVGLSADVNKGFSDAKESGNPKNSTIKNETITQELLASQKKQHQEELQKKDKEISELQNRIQSLQQQQLTEQVRHSHDMDAMENENKEFVAKLVKHHHDIVGRTKAELKEERARHKRELRSYMAASAHALRRFREGRKDKDGNSLDFPAVII